jgi:HD superfamily phosphohydrolase
VSGINHEDISLAFMKKLNKTFDGAIEDAISIFKDNYNKKFYHQLISGQLDMDRMDYLKRDSFFCGVAEGIINEDRIIKTLNVINDHIVIEAKGIYSIEKFLIARRLMYWQVYLHKTVIASEVLLMNILKRAKYLVRNGEDLFATPSFKRFLKDEYFHEDFINNPDILQSYSEIDDFDVISSVKVWQNHKDKVLSGLSGRLINRNLFKIEMQQDEFSEDYTNKIRKTTEKHLKLSDVEAGYFVISDTTSNYAYDPFFTGIQILFKDGTIKELTEASDLLNLSILARPVIKYFVCYPKEIAGV